MPPMTASGWGETLCVVGLRAATDKEAITQAVAHLGARVKPTFLAAALLRERRSPTGLPFPGTAVAIPHAEPEHVESPCVLVASLAQPVKFRQMGDPAVTVLAHLLVMPVLSSKEQAAAGLAGIIEKLQSAELRARVLAATTPEEMTAALAGVPS